MEINLIPKHFVDPTCTSVHAYTCAYTSIYRHMNTHVQMYIYIHIYIHIYVYIHMHICMYVKYCIAITHATKQQATRPTDKRAKGDHSYRQPVYIHRRFHRQPVHRQPVHRQLGHMQPVQIRIHMHTCMHPPLGGDAQTRATYT